MVRAAHSVVVIARIAGGEVQDLAAGPGQVLALSRAGRFDRGGGPGGGGEHAVDGFGERVAGEAPGGEDQLAVGVEVDEGADAGGGAVGGGGGGVGSNIAGQGGELDGKAVYGFVLWRVAWGFAAVGLAAGVWGRAALGGFGVPFEDPVAVAIGSQAGCVDVWARLAVFAPEAVVGLGVDEAWEGGWSFSLGGLLLAGDFFLLTVGVVEGDEVEVVVVEEGCHVAFAGFVAVDELVCEVFDYLRMLVSESFFVLAVGNPNIPIVDIHLR
jgi:hypothetical protein